MKKKTKKRKRIPREQPEPANELMEMWGRLLVRVTKQHGEKAIIGIFARVVPYISPDGLDALRWVIDNSHKMPTFEPSEIEVPKPAVDPDLEPWLPPNQIVPRQ